MTHTKAKSFESSCFFGERKREKGRKKERKKERERERGVSQFRVSKP